MRWSGRSDRSGRSSEGPERQAIRLACKPREGYKTLHLKMKQYGISAGQFRQS